jgi:phosphoglycolate phosphatase
MKMRYSLVLFDLDGTLLDTLDDLTEAVNYALGLRGLPLKNPEKMGAIVPEEEIRALIGRGYRPVLAHPERYLWATPAEPPLCGIF